MTSSGRSYRPIDPEVVRSAMPRLTARGRQGENGCLLWQGALVWNGYARVGGQLMYVHRAAWAAAHGRDPGPLQIDHLCNVRACFAAEHLDAVTTSVNNQRKYGDTCLRGHLLDEANTHLFRGTRRCRACARLRDAQWRQARRA
jgi:hypothetical protein